MAKTKQQLLVDNNTSFPNNNANYITPAILRAFNSDIIDSLVDEIPFAAYTQSVAVSIDNLNAFTGSSAASESLSLVTASFDNGTRNLTFTKGDTTQFSVNIPDVSGSAGNFVTTSSFNAYTASTDSSISQLNTNSASVNTSISNINSTTASINTSITNLNASSASQQVSINALNTNSASVNTSITNLNSATQSLQAQLATIGTQSGSWGGGSINTGSFATTGSNSFTGTQNFGLGAIVPNGQDIAFQMYTGSIAMRNNVGLNRLLFLDPITNQKYLYIDKDTAEVHVSGAFSAELANGYAWVGDSTGRNTQVATSSFASTINTGSFATTGSNIFVGDQTIFKSEGKLTFQSGSSNTAHVKQTALGNLELAVQNTQIALLEQNAITLQNATTINGATRINGNGKFISNNVNIDLMSNVNYSGSQYNIITEFTDVATDSSNVFSGYQVVRDSDGLNFASIAVSSYTSEYSGTPTGVILGGGQTNGSDTAIGFPTNAGIDMWKPVSIKNGIAITGSISGDAFNKFATTGSNIFVDDQTIFKSQGKLLFQSGSSNTAGMKMTALGNLQLEVQNTQIALLEQNAVTLQQPTTINGVITTNNGINTINQFGTINVMRNANFSGSQYPLGNMIVAPNQYPGDVYGGWIVTTELGNQAGQTFLGMVANTYSSQYGSTCTPMFIGGGNNPAGSDSAIGFPSNGEADHWKKSNFKYGVDVTGSLTIKSGSGDLYVHGHKQFNVGGFQTNVTQSGSANVSQSVNFEITDLSYGVTIASNSRITIANAGVYSITFSAQLLADAGADTVYMWLKKNGTNVAESATKLKLANNEESLMTVNFIVEAANNDYYELAWQSTNGDAVLYAENASGNIPAIPSVILTVTQVR